MQVGSPKFGGKLVFEVSSSNNSPAVFSSFVKGVQNAGFQRVLPLSNATLTVTPDVGGRLNLASGSQDLINAFRY